MAFNTERDKYLIFAFLIPKTVSGFTRNRLKKFFTSIILCSDFDLSAKSLVLVEYLENTGMFTYHLHKAATSY